MIDLELLEEATQLIPKRFSVDDLHRELDIAWRWEDPVRPLRSYLLRFDMTERRYLPRDFGAG